MPESELIDEPKSRRNPMIWFFLILAGLILVVIFAGDRGNDFDAAKEDGNSSEGTIERSLLVPPGMRARQYIEQVRNAGKPYSLDELFSKAQAYRDEGSLADAHLLYFFAARENHLPAIMQMGEISDPLLFRAENSLLDQSDAIQAYKWYQKAVGLGHKPAEDRILALKYWAIAESRFDNPVARQLLLNFR